MNIKHFISAAVFALAAAPTIASAAKTTICHIPPGNPDNAHAITVSDSAVAKHVSQHGDTVLSPGGTCGTPKVVVPASPIAAAVEICANSSASGKGRRIDVTGTGSVQTSGVDCS